MVLLPSPSQSDDGQMSAGPSGRPSIHRLSLCLTPVTFSVCAFSLLSSVRFNNVFSCSSLHPPVSPPRSPVWVFGGRGVVWSESYPVIAWGRSQYDGVASLWGFQELLLAGSWSGWSCSISSAAGWDLWLWGCCRLGRLPAVCGPHWPCWLCCPFPSLRHRHKVRAFRVHFFLKVPPLAARMKPTCTCWCAGWFFSQCHMLTYDFCCVFWHWCWSGSCDRKCNTHQHPLLWT